MDKSTALPPPLWEEMPPRTVPEFFGLVASEVWFRTREPECAAIIAERVLAAMQAKGSWSSIDRLVSESYHQAMERGEQGAVIGFYATAIIQARKPTNIEGLGAEEIATRAMAEAGVHPLTPEERATFQARHDAASDARQRLMADQSEKGKGE